MFGTTHHLYARDRRAFVNKMSLTWLDDIIAYPVNTHNGLGYARQVWPKVGFVQRVDA